MTFPSCTLIRDIGESEILSSFSCAIKAERCVAASPMSLDPKPSRLEE